MKTASSASLACSALQKFSKMNSLLNRLQRIAGAQTFEKSCHEHSEQRFARVTHDEDILKSPFDTKFPIEIANKSDV